MDANDAVRAGVFDPKATEPIPTPGRRSAYGGEGPRRTAEEAKRAPTDPELAKALEDLRARLGASTGRRRLKFSSAAELFAERDAGVDWLVRGLVPAQGLLAVAAEPKSTKTWAALDIALSVATASAAMGEFEVREAAPAAIFAAEDDRRALRNRLRALGSSRGVDPTNAPLHVISREALDLQSEESVADLICAVRALPERPALLVLDPLRDLHGADENDSTGMAEVMGMMRALRDVLGCAVLFVHHSAKASPETSDRRPGQRMRGSSAIHGAVDAGIYLSDLETDGQTYWQTTVTSEVKAARSAGTFGLRLEVEDDGDNGAVLARWTVAREAPAENRRAERDASAAADRLGLERKVLGVLRAAQGSPRSTKDIRAAVQGREALVAEALASLEAAGRAARHLVKGYPRGWILGPDGASDAPSDESPLPTAPYRSQAPGALPVGGTAPTAPSLYKGAVGGSGTDSWRGTDGTAPAPGSAAGGALP